MKDQDKQTLEVTVMAPRSPEGKAFSWPKTMKVGDAAKDAASKFGYAPGGTPSLENSDHRVLDNQKTLVAEHVKDGDQLELVDGGGGV